MDAVYVELVEDATSGFASTAEVRIKVDAMLKELAGPTVVRSVDRDAWLRGGEAAQGQAAMLDLVKTRGRPR